MLTAGVLRRDEPLRGMRPYTRAEARALHALAESCPTPAEYARERARILGCA